MQDMSYTHYAHLFESFRPKEAPTLKQLAGYVEEDEDKGKDMEQVHIN